VLHIVVTASPPPHLPDMHLADTLVLLSVASIAVAQTSQGGTEAPP